MSSIEYRRGIDWLHEQYPPDSPPANPCSRHFTWAMAIALTDPSVLKHFLSLPSDVTFVGVVVESCDFRPMDDKSTRAVSGLLFGQGR